MNPQWLEEMRDTGANVKVYSMDVRDKRALHSVYSNVCNTMPAVGGVINGAMVLSDTLFVDMTFEALNDVLGPKVEGTKNLNDFFEGHHLDFFIMLSSVTAAAGYRGQSNYAAANMFMVGLVNQRRQKGFAASVIDVGMLTEIGYVSRAGKFLEEYLRREKYYLPISEPEFHQMFAEAIAAGRPGCGYQPQIITGLQGARQFLDGDRPPWFSNPRFSHCVLGTDEIGPQQGGTAVAQISQRLANAGSVEEATKILLEAFTLKLAKMLQIDPASSIHERAPLLHLGVDSLIAIEIRSWFIREIDVELPILMVLGGSSAAELVRRQCGSFFQGGKKAVSDNDTHDNARGQN